MSSPPPWQMPFTALTIGFRELRIASNGVVSIPRRPVTLPQSSSVGPPRSPPGMNTSPVPVRSMPDSVGSALTTSTAYRTAKYIAPVMALRASGRSTMQLAKLPFRSNRT